LVLQIPDPLIYCCKLDPQLALLASQVVNVLLDPLAERVVMIHVPVDYTLKLHEFIRTHFLDVLEATVEGVQRLLLRDGDYLF
jgi:hypothetical protein